MQFTWIINEIFSKINLTEKTVFRLKNKSYPCKTPILFLECLNKVLSLVKMHVSKLKDAYLPEPDIVSETALLNELSSHLYIVRTLTWPLQWIENSGTENVAWSLINPFEETVKSINPDVKLILSSHYDEYNYFSIDILSHYRKIIEEGGYLKKSDFNTQIDDIYLLWLQINQENKSKKKHLRKLGFLRFPKIEKISVFQHVLLGHEIAHNFFGQYEELLIKLTIDESKYIHKQIDKFVKENYIGITEIEAEIWRAQTYERFNHFFKNGTKEIFCDLFAQKLFGISFAFAAYNFCITSESLDEFQGTHPPWRYRLRVLMKYIDIEKIHNAIKTQNIRYNDFYKDHHKFIKLIIDKLELKLQDFENIIGDYSDKDEIRSEKHIELAYEIIDKNLDKIQESVITCLKPCLYSSDLNLDMNEILKLCCRLLDNIIPNEIASFIEYNGLDNKEKVDFRHIILAGWLFKITKLDSITNTKESIKETKKINRLILKAIELNDIKREKFG